MLVFVFVTVVERVKELVLRVLYFVTVELV